jgi:hypothetical protein
VAVVCGFFLFIYLFFFFTLTLTLTLQVEVADCMQTLFRGNSLASKIMAYCFRFYGQWYLCDLLSPLIQEMFMLEREHQV